MCLRYGKEALRELLVDVLSHAARTPKAHRRKPTVDEPILAKGERLALMARKAEELGFAGSWAPKAAPGDNLGKSESGGGVGGASGLDAAAEDDDEIEVVGGKGEGHDFVYPHLRSCCTAKPFNPGKATNEAFCAECYCYICDVPASECVSWAGQHCHATDQNPAHVAMRKAKTDLTWFDAAVVWCQDCGLLDEHGKPEGSSRFSSNLSLTVPRFLNRILGLPVRQQNSLFAYFMEVLEAVVKTAKSAGTYDEGVRTLKGRSITFDPAAAPRTLEPATLLADMAGLHLHYWRARVDRGLSFAEACALRREALDSEAANPRLLGRGGSLGGGTDMRRAARQAADARFTGFWVQKEKFFGRFSVLLAVRTLSASAFTSNKTRIYRAGVGENSIYTPKLFELYEPATDARAQELWDAEYADRAVNCIHGPKCKYKESCTFGRRVLESHILAGSVVPLWGAIESIVNKRRYGEKTQRFRIVRAVETDSGGGGGGTSSLSSNNSNSSSSSSSRSSSSATAATRARQCIGIEVDGRLIDQVLEGLEKGSIA